MRGLADEQLVYRFNPVPHRQLRRRLKMRLAADVGGENPDGLAALERAIRACDEAGVDAVIVQDLGVMKLARAIAPGLAVHASTQMTCTDAASVELAKELGATRVILARELSIDDITKIKAGTDVEVEVFVHGALCISYSGQCLTSEAIGGRSANRGACAQACRLPYELVVDGDAHHPGAGAAQLLALLDGGVDVARLRRAHALHDQRRSALRCRTLERTRGSRTTPSAR